MTENTLMKKIQVGVIDDRTRMFRNNVGKGWQGKHSFLEDGSMILQYPRRINFGLCVGSSDLIGFRSIEITPEMVGQKIAVFSALEVKTDEGRESTEQTAFIETVKTMGGLAGSCRSLDEADWILRK